MFLYSSTLVGEPHSPLWQVIVNLTMLVTLWILTNAQHFHLFLVDCHSILDYWIEKNKTDRCT